MAYKRYIKKGGKRYGPYIYESKKENGKVVSTYLGRKKDLEGKKGSVKDKSATAKKIVSKKKVVRRNIKKINRRIKSNKKLIQKKAKKFNRKIKSKNRAIRRKIKTRAFKNKAKKVGKGVSLIFICGVFIFFFLCFLNFNITGKVGLDIKSEYLDGENLQGSFRFNLKEGELIPENTRLIVQFDDQHFDYALSDFVELETFEGGFYAENASILGEGVGYGLIGTKKIYPEVNFDLKIFDATENLTEIKEEIPVEEIVEQNEAIEDIQEDSEVNETIISEDEEQTSESQSQIIDIVTAPLGVLKGADKEEKPKESNEEKEESKEEKKSDSGESSESTDSSLEESTGSLMTGEVISPRDDPGGPLENFEIVSGVVTADKDFNYKIEEGQTAEFVDRSVKINGSVVDESFLDLKVKKQEVVVSFDYYGEKGFGEEYLGNKKLGFNIELDNLALKVNNNSMLFVKLVYGNETFVEGFKELSVTIPEGALDEQNLTVEKNITITNDTIVYQIIEDVTIDSVDLTINTTQYGAVLNMPVQWKKNIQFVNKTTDDLNVTITLPKEAENITVYKIDKETSEITKEVENVSVEGVIPFMDVANQTDSGEGVVELNETSEESNETEVLNSVENVGGVGNISEQNVKEKIENKTRQQKGFTARVVSGKISVDIEIYEGFSIKNIFKNIFKAITGKIVEVEKKESETSVIIRGNSTEYEIEYMTPGPVAFEANSSEGKKILISSEVHYENILAFTEIPLKVNISQVKLYHFVEGKKVLVDFDSYDSNWTKIESSIDYSRWQEEEKIVENKSMIYNESANLSRNVSSNFDFNLNVSANATCSDCEVAYDFVNPNVKYITWVVPSLSSPRDDFGRSSGEPNQTYELIIEITKAEHLDENRNFVSYIYEEVKARDGIWSEVISDGEYVRVNFEKNLTSENDVTVYARTVNWTNGSEMSSVGVYLGNSDELITIIENISTGKWYKTYLTNMDGENDVFDLKISGEVEFDFIVDPEYYDTLCENWTGGTFYQTECNGGNITLIINKTGRTYDNMTGNYTSNVFDAGSAVRWNNLNWNATTQSSTNITFQTRASTDGVIWDTWSAGLTNLSVRYLQYKANLITTSTSVTPFLEWVNLSYALREPSLIKFEIKNSSGSTVASIDNKGDMYLKGTKSESQGSLTPTPNSFIVKDSSGSVISYVNSTGSLFLKGTASTGLTSLTTTNFEFKNSDGGLIAFFDNTGNLKLNGTVFVSYANP